MTALVAGGEAAAGKGVALTWISHTSGKLDPTKPLAQGCHDSKGTVFMP
jgi:hypothetical protein